MADGFGELIAQLQVNFAGPLRLTDCYSRGRSIAAAGLASSVTQRVTATDAGLLSQSITDTPALFDVIHWPAQRTGTINASDEQRATGRGVRRLDLRHSCAQQPAGAGN
jgi:hypothetical protein